jgi:glycosyltransferase involved in cell wall biosynthesis
MIPWFNYKGNWRPKMTLITCHYYRPDLLRRAIQSAQRQTLQDFEHLIISDHCPFTKHVYNDFKDDDRIKLLEVGGPHIPNMGAIPFNLGIEKARSNHIAYLCDDDILCENHLSDHYDFLQENDFKSVSSTLVIVQFLDDKSTIKDICSTSFEDLWKNKKIKNIYGKFGNVSAFSHIAPDDKRWRPCSGKDMKLNKCPAEDNQFLGQWSGNNDKDIGKLETVTHLRISWGEKHRTSDLGVNKKYSKLLKEKLVEDKRTRSGYRMVSDSPYVYPELKNTLYGDN